MVVHSAQFAICPGTLKFFLAIKYNALSKASSNFSSDEYRHRFRIKRHRISPSPTLWWLLVLATREYLHCYLIIVNIVSFLPYLLNSKKGKKLNLKTVRMAAGGSKDKGPPNGKATPNAAPFDLKISADILCVISGDLRQSVAELFYSLLAGPSLHSVVQY